MRDHNACDLHFVDEIGNQGFILFVEVGGTLVENKDVRCAAAPWVTAVIRLKPVRTNYADDARPVEKRKAAAKNTKGPVAKKNGAVACPA